MRQPISIVIPAWNEERRIGETLRSLRLAGDEYADAELIVVDDGSSDDTSDQAHDFADRVLRHVRRRGKGEALNTGWKTARGDIVIMLDADLGTTAKHWPMLLRPVLTGEADMSVARLPAAQRKGGFGLVKGFASHGIYRLSGFRARAPLSGQRAVRKRVLERIGGLCKGFGIEVGLTIDAARLGFRIAEVDVPFRHRESGRDWQGYVHRGRQFVEVGRTLLDKWRNPVC